MATGPKDRRTGPNTPDQGQDNPEKTETTTSPAAGPPAKSGIPGSTTPPNEAGRQPGGPPEQPGAADEPTKDKVVPEQPGAVDSVAASPSPEATRRDPDSLVVPVAAATPTSSDTERME